MVKEEIAEVDAETPRKKKKKRKSMGGDAAGEEGDGAGENGAAAAAASAKKKKKRKSVGGALGDDGDGDAAGEGSVRFTYHVIPFSLLPLAFFVAFTLSADVDVGLYAFSYRSGREKLVTQSVGRLGSSIWLVVRVVRDRLYSGFCVA